jgi:hypothetical protein
MTYNFSVAIESDLDIPANDSSVNAILTLLGTMYATGSIDSFSYARTAPELYRLELVMGDARTWTHTAAFTGGTSNPQLSITQNATFAASEIGQIQQLQSLLVPLTNVFGISNFGVDWT